MTNDTGPSHKRTGVPGIREDFPVRYEPVAQQDLSEHRPRLLAASRGGPCRVYQSDIKVITTDEHVYCPDVMVAREEAPEDEYVEDAPCVLVEVISPNTETIDLREKLSSYKAIPSLGAYLTVAQDRRWVSHYFQDENGVWRRGDLVNEGVITVTRPPETELSLDDIYAETGNGVSPRLTSFRAARVRGRGSAWW